MLKNLSFWVVILAFPIAVNDATASGALSWGAGVGALYSGLGVNLGLKSGNDFRYIAVGCISANHTAQDGTHAACGVGAGWILSDILSTTGNNHGLGLYVGPVGARLGDAFGSDLRTIYGAGLTYTYFFHGIDRSGFNMGISPNIGWFDGREEIHLLLQFGYQF